MNRLPRRWSRLAEGARRLDHQLWRCVGARKVLIEARTPMNLAVLRPLVAPLLTDSRVTVCFTGVHRALVEEAATDLGLQAPFVSRDEVSWARWDVYLNADPWEAVRLRRARRQVNFCHGVAGKYDLDCPVGLPISFERYARVAFPNRSRLQHYVEAGLVTMEQAALVGYPKVDTLVNDPVPPRELVADLGLDPARPTVIYAPTFSPASSLHDAGERIIATLLARGCNTIVKLHDRSLQPDPRYTDGIDWPQRLAMFAGNPGFLFARGGDSTRYVRASDVMVTDHSSIGFEFCAVNRPVIVYDAPRLAAAARINPARIALLRSAATVVTTEQELSAALQQALDSPGLLAGERRRVANEVFHQPGTATTRALGLVYELLELPPVAQLSHPERVWSAAE
jgi:hypothetical protein